MSTPPNYSAASIVSGEASPVDLDRYLDSVLQEAIDIAETTQGSLMLVHNREQVLEIMERRGPPFERRRYHRFKVGEGIAGLVAKNSKPYLIGDVLSEPEFKAPVGILHFHSLLAVPILSAEGTPIGVICVDSPTINKFDQSHQEKLVEVGRRVGAKVSKFLLDTFIIYLKRVRQLESLHQVGQQLSRLIFESPEGLDELLQKVAQLGRDVLEADLVTLYRYYRETNTFGSPPVLSGDFKVRKYMVEAVHPGDAPYRVVERGKPYYSAEARNDMLMRARVSVPASRELPEREPFVNREQIESSAGIPLEAAGEIVGVFFINYRIPHPFPEDEKHVIETFAAYAALAIQGARRFEEALYMRRHEALRLTSRMVAHRLRNVLPAISHWVERILESEALSSKANEWCHVALREARRAQAIVSDFETFSRTEVFDRPDVLTGGQVVNKLTQIVHENLTCEADITANSTPEVADVEVSVNFDRLSDDIAAFVQDSIRHKQVGLRIALSARLADPADLQRAMLSNERTYLVLVFTDNGPGIRADLKHRVFQPFYSTAGGTGLGLTIAKRDAEVHGGTLIETGQPGSGVQFEFYLPARRIPGEAVKHA